MLKKYRVTLRPDIDDVTIVVEAVNEEQAMEMAEEEYAYGDIPVENFDSDVSGAACATAIEAEDITYESNQSN